MPLGFERRKTLAELRGELPLHVDRDHAHASPRKRLSTAQVHRYRAGLRSQCWCTLPYVNYLMSVNVGKKGYLGALTLRAP